jgi:hypothetical protein
MRQTAVGLYILGTVVLVIALFATGAKPDKAAVLAGGIAVLVAAVLNMSMRRRRPQTDTTTDWLRGRRARRNPVRTLLWLLGLFFAGANVLLLDSPYSGSRHYFVFALLLVYVTIVGLDLFDKLDTPLLRRPTGSENNAPL